MTKVGLLHFSIELGVGIAMVEYVQLEERLMATVYGRLEPSDYERIGDVDILQISPKHPHFEIEQPLHLDHLQILAVGCCEQPISEMFDVDTLRRVHNLTFAESPGSLRGVLGLGEMPQLRSLAIRQQLMDGEVVEWVIRQAQIVLLSLTDTNFSDSMMSRLACKSGLKRLDAFRSNLLLDNRDVFNETFPRVRYLDVSGTGVSQDSIAVIHWLFPNLELFRAKKTRLGEADVRAIAAWENLRVLQTGNPDVDFDHYGDPFWDL